MTNVSREFKLSVYRRLENRFENLPDDSPRAVELHVLRKVTLNEALSPDTGLIVLDWGDTNDVKPHEMVELLGSWAGTALHYAVIPAVLWISKKLAEKAVDEGLSELMKYLFSLLKRPQADKKILNFYVELSDGTRMDVDPPDRDAKIFISFADGEVVSYDYRADREVK
ncbi:hypothetical protein [Caballeronia sp. HLA56]